MKGTACILLSLALAGGTAGCGDKVEKGCENAVKIHTKWVSEGGHDEKMWRTIEFCKKALDNCRNKEAIADCYAGASDMEGVGTCMQKCDKIDH